MPMWRLTAVLLLEQLTCNMVAALNFASVPTQVYGVEAVGTVKPVSLIETAEDMEAALAAAASEATETRVSGLDLAPCSEEELLDKDIDLVIFGASGVTGGLSSEYLGKGHHDNPRWAIAGRSPKKLEELNNRLPNKPQAIIVADLGDQASLENMTKRAKVILSFAGPYEESGGEALIKAAINKCAHYVDVAGENAWKQTMLEKYGRPAEVRGVSLVQSAGFDSLPADLMGSMAAIDFLEDQSMVPERIKVVYTKLSGGLKDHRHHRKNPRDPYFLTSLVPGAQAVEMTSRKVNLKKVAVSSAFSSSMTKQQKDGDTTLDGLGIGFDHDASAFLQSTLAGFIDAPVLRRSLGLLYPNTVVRVSVAQTGEASALATGYACQDNREFVHIGGNMENILGTEAACEYECNQFDWCSAFVRYPDPDGRMRCQFKGLEPELKDGIYRVCFKTGPVPKMSEKWVMGSNGTNCDDTCGTLSMTCDSAPQRTLVNNGELEGAFLAAGYQCLGYGAFHPEMLFREKAVYYAARSGAAFSNGRSGDDCYSIMVGGGVPNCATPAYPGTRPLCYCKGEYTEFLEGTSSVSRVVAAQGGKGRQEGHHSILKSQAKPAVIQAGETASSLVLGHHGASVSSIANIATKSVDEPEVNKHDVILMQGRSRRKRREGEFAGYAIAKKGDRKLCVGMHGKGDPGYLATAKMATELALGLAFQAPNRERVGYMTPASAMEPRTLQTRLMQVDGGGSFKFDSKCPHVSS